MADQENEKQLDHLLDSLLSQYSQVEPRPGLQTRLLARIAKARVAGAADIFDLSWLWAGLASAGALTVIIVLFVFFSRPMQRKQPPDRIAQIQPQTAPQAPGQAAALHRPQTLIAAHKRKMRKVGQVALAEVKQKLFPTPVPLSEQERLMFTYVANTPHQEVVAQIQRNDQQEAEAFWKDNELGPANQRSPIR